MTADELAALKELRKEVGENLKRVSHSEGAFTLPGVYHLVASIEIMDRLIASHKRKPRK